MTAVSDFVLLLTIAWITYGVDGTCGTAAMPAMHGMKYNGSGIAWGGDCVLEKTQNSKSLRRYADMILQFSLTKY